VGKAVPQIFDLAHEISPFLFGLEPDLFEEWRCLPKDGRFVPKLEATRQAGLLFSPVAVLMDFFGVFEALLADEGPPSGFR
jgi:hypothetical protein